MSDDEPIALSFAQRRLWFLEQVTVTPAFNMPSAVWLRGRLDVDALERSLSTIVERHEALRTRFVERQGDVVQEIVSASAFALRVRTFDEYPEEERLTRAMSCAQAEAVARFDVTTGPLIRAQLLRLAPEDHLLTLTLHHAAADGRSIAVLTRELSILYDAFTSGRESPLATLPVQYRDYSAWQRREVDEDITRREIAYWRHRLVGAPAALSWHGDRPATVTSNGARFRQDITADINRGVREIGRRLEVSPFTILLGAFQLVLSRHTGQRDLCVGVPVAGRGRPELENMIGLFINMLALRTTVSPGMPVGRWLREIGTSVTAALSHQTVPFERVVEEVQAERRLDVSPLFQTMFIYDQAPPEPLRLAGLDVERIELETHTAKYDLTLSISESEDGLQAAWEYATDLFDRAAVEQMAGHFGTLLREVIASDRRQVGELSILSPAEQRVLHAWNGTAGAAEPPPSVLELFEQQVEAYGDAPAVVCGGHTWSYRDINEQANALARELRRRGVQRETRVGIWLERSAQMVIAQLGVLKAGGAYVPLDPAYPVERLGYMSRDAELTWVITERSRSIEGTWAATEPVELVTLDGERCPTNGDLIPAPDSAAYVIYTSGSTGQPKGTVVSHRGLSNVLTSFSRDLGLGPADGWLAVTTLSFDIAVLELLAPLTVGGRTIVATASDVQDTRRLCERLDEAQVTVAQATPALWRTVLEAGWAGRPELTVLCGGEAMDAELAAALCARSHRVWNVYGPTETTVWSTAQRLLPPDASVSLGSPVAQTQVYVLDCDLQLAPVGVPGELYIGGAGVARGYLKRAALTATRFVADPYASAAGSRMYRTGDRCRRRSDGNLEYLGRVDHQVKVRGYRVEPGEIEKALREHEAIREAVVVGAPEPGAGGVRLVAYVVTRAGHDLSVDALQRYLRARLPEYMVPPTVTFLAALPRTPNGKIDRKALPAPDTCRPELATSFAAPESADEQMLVGIWRRVLSVPHIGVHDNFFALGGHSIRAMQVIRQVRETAGLDLPVRTIFEHPTIRALAEEIRAARDRQCPGVPKLLAASRDEAVPLSSAQHGLWVHHELNPSAVSYNIPFAWRIAGPLNVRALEQAFDDVVRRHESLRTRFAIRDGRPVQVIDPCRPGMLETTALGSRSLDDLMREHARTPFSFADGTLCRATLVDAGPDEHVLLLTIHHIIFDGSAEIFFRDLAAAYRAHDEGTPAELPDLPIQYADYAVWDRSRAGESEPTLDYWRQQLAGRLPVLDLPVSRSDAGEDSSGNVQSVRIAPGLVARLQELSRREDVTLYMTLLAAFQQLLSIYSGQDDILVGSPVVSRPDQQLEAVVGCFVNVVVMRTALPVHATVRELLRSVRNTALDAYSHQDVPFERVLEALRVERVAGRPPLFQAMFSLQQRVTEPPRLAGVRVTPLETSTGEARFDLLLALREADEGLIGTLEYDSARYSGSMMRRLMAHYERLLESICAHPEARLSEARVLSDAERRRILGDWNDDYGPFARHRCAHHLVEEQAARAPHRPAVILQNQELSYGELNESANRLGHLLIQRGCCAGGFVAVCVERSAAIPAVLGVLKSGAAYVPLEPHGPAARLRYILSTLRVPVVVTSPSWLPRLREVLAGTDVRDIVCLGDAAPALQHAEPWESVFHWDDAALRRMPAINPEVDIPSDSLAYVIFTSGSTGAPKGVAVTHQPVINLIEWLNPTFGVDASDRLLFVTSLCFDLSVYDMFGLLAAGGSIRVASEEELDDPERLVGILMDEPITFWDSAPAALQRIAPLLSKARQNTCLRRVFLSGDWIPLGLPPTVRDTFPAADVISLGGATEATVWSNFFRIGGVDRRWVSIPYGRPMRNASYYVLDRHLNPCPVDVPGYLFIGGECLATGYINEPALTAGAFVPDPFRDVPGARMYRTGDIARFWADGNLEFLGRKDNQVKIRGFRIELGEIEAALSRHEEVAACAAIARQDASGEKRLVAYVVPKPATAPSSAALRDHVRQTVPEYMVPSAFICLPELPVTANGKLDVRALPSPERGETSSADAAPGSPIEEALVKIWKQVLGVAHVGLDDNFFELGGDSILNIQVAARCRAAGLDLRPTDIFEHQTVRALAAVCGVSQASADEAADRGDIPLTPIQRWFFERASGDINHWNQAVRLEAREQIDVRRLRGAFAAVTQLHQAFNLRFTRSASEWIQSLDDQGAAAFRTIDLSAMPDVERAAACAAAVGELHQSLDITAGPTIACAVIHRGNDEGDQVLIAAHHLVVDSVSWRILLEDFSALYESPAADPRDTVVQTAPYAEWARQLDHYVATADLTRDLTWWLSHLPQDMPPLPADQDLGPNVEGAACTLTTSLDEGTTHALAQMLAKHQVSLRDALLAATVDTLAGWTGRSRVLLSLEGHGRELDVGADVSRTVGWFTNMHPAAFTSGERSGLASTLDVREQLQAIPAGGLSYGLLRYGRQRPAEAARLEDVEPDVSFNYLGQLARPGDGMTRFRLADVPPGRLRSASAARRHLIDISGRIVGGGLRIVWTYSSHRHTDDTVRRLAGQQVARLCALLEE